MLGTGAVRGFLVVTALLLLTAAAFANPPGIRDIEEEYFHRSWNRENGLPDSEVVAILQGRDGYIWVATPYSLARYDGTRFVVFDRPKLPGLERARNYAMAEDNSGTLWITTDAGFLVYSLEGCKLVRTPREDPIFQPVAASSRGGVWSFLNPPSPQIHHLDQHGGVASYDLPLAGKTPTSAVAITSVLELPDQRVWLGEQSGGFWVNPTFTKIEEVNGFPHAQKPFCHAVVFEPDGTGYDLLGDYLQMTAQLYRIEKARATLCATNVIDNMGRRIFLSQDRLGNLWMPAGKRSLFRYAQDQMTEFRVPGGFDDDYPLCLHEDRDRNLWFGSSHSGLHCLQPRRVHSLTIRNGLAGSTAECLAETPDGSVWIGTENGLSRFADNRCTNYDETHGLARRIIRSLAVDREGVLWVGTLRGLHKFEDGTFRPYPFPGGEAESKIRAILAAKDGGLWVATVRGLCCVYQGRHTKLTVAHGLSTNEVLSLLEDRSGVLWAGTPGGGLNRLSWPRTADNGANDPLAAVTNVSVTVLSTTNGLSSNVIRALHQDADGVLWLGTDHGLNRYEHGVVTVFTTRQGLPEDQISELLEDASGRFWMGGNRSVYHVARADLNKVAAGLADSVTPVSYSQVDGFPSLEVSGKFSQPAMCRTHDGRIWIGTARGAAILDPEDLPESTNAPAVVIEQIRANGKVVFDNGPLAWTNSPGSNRTSNSSGLRIASKSTFLRPNLKATIHLPPGSAHILEIQYTANTFVASEAARFKYRLEGWDKDWIDGGTARKAYYANLHPGDYRFYVVAAAKDGRWSETQATASFHLAPFFYETVWCYGLCGAVTCLAAYVGVSSRLRKTRRIAELERQIALDDQRKRIARDIHDELGASLTQIAQLSDDAQWFQDQPDQAQTQTRRIAALAEEAVANIGEIVWANNPRYDTLEDLVAYLREYSAKYLGTASLESHLVFPQKVPERGVPGPFRRYLLAILKEALHNVLKHSRAKAVEVILLLNATHLELTVRDNGGGFDPDNDSRLGNGLINMRERSVELGGSCEITSKPGQGAILRVTLPLPKLPSG